MCTVSKEWLTSLGGQEGKLVVSSMVKTLAKKSLSTSTFSVSVHAMPPFGIFMFEIDSLDFSLDFA